MAETQWYYRQGERTIGPIGEAQLRELADQGELRPGTYVWREGMADWVPAGHVPGLLAVGTPPPPPGGSSLAPPTEPGPHGGMAGSAPFVGYGGFWRRLVAFLIDGILLGVVTGSLEAVLGGESRGGLETLVGWLYFALMESSRHQATLGKMALGDARDRPAGRADLVPPGDGALLREDPLGADPVHRVPHGRLHAAEAGPARRPCRHAGDADGSVSGARTRGLCPARPRAHRACLHASAVPRSGARLLPLVAMTLAYHTALSLRMRLPVG